MANFTKNDFFSDSDKDFPSLLSSEKLSSYLRFFEVGKWFEFPIQNINVNDNS